MQGHGGTPAELAVLSGERSFHVQLQVDWNKNGLYNHALSNMAPFMSSAVTDRSLNKSTAAQLTLTLGGVDDQGRSLSSIFSPFQVNSPFWAFELIGCEVTYKIGLDTSIGVVWYPQFVGNIRSIAPDRGSNSVEITALDRVETLRKPVLIAPWAVSEQIISQGKLEAQLLKSHHLIDHAVRQCDCSTSPWRPITKDEAGGSAWSGPQFFLTGNGGVVPTVGWVDNFTEQEYPNTEGGVKMYDAIGETHPSAPDPTTKPDVLAAVGGLTSQDRLLYWVRDRAAINGLASHVMGFTLIQGAGQNPNYWSTMPDTKVLACRSNDEIEMQIWINAGTVRTEWDRGGPSPLHIVGPSVTIPAGTSCQIHVAWDAFNAAGPMAYIAAGANNSGVVDLGSAISFVSASDELAGFVDIGRQVAMQDIYFTSTNFGGIGAGLSYKPKAAKYAASIDQGLNRISFIPEDGKPQAWDICKSVAETEQGAVFWDEDGKFRFWSFDRIQGLKNTIAREITLDDLAQLRIESTLDSVRNVYAVTKSKARSVLAVAYESQDVDEFYTPGVSIKTFKLYLDDTQSPDPQQMSRFKDTSSDPVAVWDDDVRHGYVFQRLSGGVWSEAVNGNTQGVDITCYYDENGAITVRIVNGWAEPIRLARGNGDDSYPAFRMQGTKVVHYDDFTSVSQSNASVAKYMPQTLEVSGKWVQEYIDYAGLITKLLTKTSAPAPETDQIIIAGDPRLQMGDALRLRDTEGFGYRFDMQILGIRRQFEVDSGLTDTLTVELLPTAGIWDDPVYGIWDQTFVWG